MPRKVRGNHTTLRGFRDHPDPIPSITARAKPSDVGYYDFTPARPTVHNSDAHSRIARDAKGPSQLPTRRVDNAPVEEGFGESDARFTTSGR